jgi:hypothetical protein
MDDWQEDEQKQDFLRKRGVGWAALLVLLIATVVTFPHIHWMTAHTLPSH